MHVFHLLMDSNLYYPRLEQSDCGICGYVRQKGHVPYLAVSLTVQLWHLVFLQPLLL